MKTIKSWAPEDRPREKLVEKGREALSDAELLAIILASGSKDESAVSLARRILASTESLSSLGKKDLSFFTDFKGVGMAKAITIAAALELGRRRQSEKGQDRTVIKATEDIYRLMAPQLQDLPYEEFWLLLLNGKGVVLAKEKISSGGLKQTVVDPKRVFTKALAHNAFAIVLVHNHPIGSPRPSQHDINLTEKLYKGCRLLEMTLVDHVIIVDGDYYSFRDDASSSVIP